MDMCDAFKQNGAMCFCERLAKTFIKSTEQNIYALLRRIYTSAPRDEGDPCGGVETFDIYFGWLWWEYNVA